MRFAILLAALLCPVAASAEAPVPADPAVDVQPAAPAMDYEPGSLLATGAAGGAGVYHVINGDNLTLVAARLGAWLPQLFRDNPLDKRAFLRIGQPLNYDNRHLVPPAPQAAGQAILINIPQRMLFHYADGELRGAYPAAAGKPDWETPTGDTTIASREKDKTWVVPVSIQREMRANGQRVRTRVPAGPDNPLGRYWLGLAREGYGIHGTNAPASVYGARTHGCIRLQPEHIEALFQDVSRGVPVRIIYAPVLLFAPPNGPIWLEVHPDAYARGLDYMALLRKTADEAGVTERIDWQLAESVLTQQNGIAQDVAAKAAPEYP